MFTLTKLSLPAIESNFLSIKSETKGYFAPHVELKAIYNGLHSYTPNLILISNLHSVFYLDF